MFSKNLYFFMKNGDFVENIFGKKLIFFLAFLTFLIGCATKFHSDELFFFLSILFGSKVAAFFVKKWPKLNCELALLRESVIAID